MAQRTLIATMGFDVRHVLPAMRLMPYDRLVLVAGRNAFRSAGFRRLRTLEPDLAAVGVDPFDLERCLESIRGAIHAAARQGPVRISVGGGTKILTNAAILAAFQEGVESWYCDPDPVRLPVLRGVQLRNAFPPAERGVAQMVRGPVSDDDLVAATTARGFARRTVVGAIRSLAEKGLLDLVGDSGHVIVRPSARFALFRDHLRERPEKA